ncbi:MULTISPECIES: beta-ketoacyl-ACP synthase II [Pedobacter]|uniref:3-oxoacyl-[acyl-carrier-protein] synthase 2 n=1 Tax=Pedobacter heparinus (strain ATCC 13125 / DSM 2366 / CIP 104194 / JCM 7457 / NBRC 12017 / NCIMB 9290 / NRRL B-14731 / HIM 762-3) TaxID=485917 RepID=C6XUH4_PEDHD|nr:MULTISPECIES: beta-ketoacyl-ACP synthase II [Pedobacter]ACU03824.1 3-oxoacyl-(acyl-carrier-protein) synthase 2 [Pedobacter heparinus DSM 2366]MBB5436654.1 3-oxoacyl-[acyl-carrier-protein] synthase II [Pedobacter sp. AK017]
MKRVVVTGLGAITPLGNTVSEFWKNIVAGKSGAAAITKFDTSKFKTNFAAEVKDFNIEAYIDKKEVKKYDLYTQYAIAASDQAIQDSGLNFETMPETERYEVGVIWASGNGGIGTFEQQLKEYHLGDGTPRFSPYFIPKMIVDIAAGVISIRHKLHGPNYATVSACASSNTAIISAFDTIRLGKANIMVAGGSEAAITESSVGGFNSAHALSKRNDDPAGASRPFDKDRDGFVIGEGAGALILEELEHAKARGAHIYAEIVGGGMAADAYHLTGTPPDGLGASLGIAKALAEAGIGAEKIDYINAHATSTGLGDIGELHGIKKVFKDLPVAISATKSMTGHLLGGAGAIESIISVMAIKDGIIPGTINTENIDPEIPEGLNLIIGKSVYQPVNYVLNNTFGFGGHTATSIFKKYGAD